MLDTAMETPIRVELLYEPLLESWPKLEAVVDACHVLSQQLHKSATGARVRQLRDDIKAAIVDFRSDFPIEDSRLMVENWRRGRLFWQELLRLVSDGIAIVPERETPEERLEELTEDIKSALDNVQESWLFMTTYYIREEDDVIAAGESGYRRRFLN